ncbi:hypothetical protein H6P81_005530 [Aristolochia fimbriata]|uniref:Uncharacterized protein n=1 Tax=Aristolochia fimbriata TaxID=158543 RepID=A0AAV7EYG0_ARIFI|nr:hypothetical protein H6P81_005530 [Aristolochia fimbriata]
MVTPEPEQNRAVRNEAGLGRIREEGDSFNATKSPNPSVPLHRSPDRRTIEVKSRITCQSAAADDGGRTPATASAARSRRLNSFERRR